MTVLISKYFHMITYILMLYVAYFSVSDSLCICTIGEGKRSSSTRSRVRLTSGRSGVLICTGAAAKASKQHVLTSKRLYLYKHLISSKPQYLFLVVILWLNVYLIFLYSYIHIFNRSLYSLDIN